MQNAIRFVFFFLISNYLTIHCQKGPRVNALLTIEECYKKNYFYRNNDLNPKKKK